MVVVENPDGVDAIAASVRSNAGIAFVADPQTSPDRAISVFTAYPTTSPQSPATEQLVRDLRHELPANAHIGGQTASGIDFAAFMAQRLPVFIGAVLVVSFLLLLAVFRSLLVPLKAVILNLVSIGAAYGAMVAVFQWGWLASVINWSPRRSNRGRP